MKVAGIKMNDPWASRASRDKNVHMEEVSGVSVETDVHMEQVSFEHHGPEQNYRPLLHLSGELRGITPSDTLPYGIDEITFRPGLGPMVDAFYEFDDLQLKELVSKGYFNEGFEPPANMTGILWQLPTTIDASVMAPEYVDDPPIVFVTVHGQAELALTLNNSGYDLVEYFDNHQRPEAQQELAGFDLPVGTPEYEGDGRSDLFGDETFDSPDERRIQEMSPASRVGSPAAYPTVQPSVFESLMAEYEDRQAQADAQRTIEAEVAEVENETEYEPTLAELVYQDRIAPSVESELEPIEFGGSASTEKADTAEPVATTVAETDELEESVGLGISPLDLDEDDEELGIVPIAIGSAPLYRTPSAADRARKVQRTKEHELALAALADKDDNNHGDITPDQP